MRSGCGCGGSSETGGRSSGAWWEWKGGCYATFIVHTCPRACPPPAALSMAHKLQGCVRGVRARRLAALCASLALVKWRDESHTERYRSLLTGRVWIDCRPPLLRHHDIPERPPVPQVRDWMVGWNGVRWDRVWPALADSSHPVAGGGLPRLLRLLRRPARNAVLPSMPRALL